PIVSKDILAAVIRTVADEGRTVLFSSHLLEEIERVSDYVAMLHQGKLVFCGALDEIKTQYRRVILRFESPLAFAPAIADALYLGGDGREWTFLCNGARNHVLTVAANLGASIVDDQAPSLTEIFVGHAG